MSFQCHLLIVGPEHKKKNLKTYENILEHKVYFESKLVFDPMVKTKRLDKFNLQRIYNIHSFDNRRASCLCFKNHYQTKEN